MEEKALQQILEAEKKADEIVSQGVRKAAELSDEVAAEIKNIRSEFDETIEAEVKQIIEAKKAEGTREAEKIDLSVVNQCEKIEKQAASNMEKAVDFVFKNIGDGTWQ